MKKRELNKWISTSNVQSLYLLFAFMNLCVTNVTAQMDSTMKSLTLSDFEHAYDVKDIEELSKDFVKNNDVIPFNTLFLERTKEGWAYETDSCLFDNHSAQFLDSFNVGTKVIYCGLARSIAVKRRKGFRSVSYKLPDNISFQDTLKFSFITLADGIGGFQPSIYFSKKVKILVGPSKCTLLKNGRYLKYAQKMPNRSVDDYGLTTSEFELIITKKLRKLKWIHLVNDFYGDEGGFIVGSGYTLNPKPLEITSDSIELGSIHIYFDNDSSIIPIDELHKLAQIIEQCKLMDGYKILVSAFADKSGNIEKNLILASNRANSVVKFLSDNGINESNIFIDKLSIGNFGSAEENRVCTIKIVN